jgi:signal transduction histidine kinase
MMIARAKRWLQPYPDTAGALRLGFVASYIGIVGPLVIYSNLVSPGSAGAPRWREWALIGLVGLMFFVERFELARDNQPVPRRLAVFLLLLRMALVQGVVALDSTKLGVILYPLVPFAAFFSLGVYASRLIGGALWWLVAILAWQTGSIGPQTNFSSLTIVVIFTLILIFLLVIAGQIDRDQRSRQQMRQLLVELEASHRQLQDYAARVAELATAAERNRLARDIHDSIGHYLTAINIQLEKAQAYRARDPEEADQAIRDAKQTARAALQDVRQSVSALRTGSERFSLKKSLADLVQRMECDAFAIDYHLVGDEADYAGSVLTVLYRVAQEGLTNVQKHAHARRVELAVELGDAQACLRMSDDGIGFDVSRLTTLAQSANPGYGIVGLQERLESVRGQMNITSQAGHGTELTVTVPKNPAQLAVL